MKAILVGFSVAKGVKNERWDRFGHRLKLARLRAGLTQVELTEKCNSFSGHGTYGTKIKPKGTSNSWLVYLENGTNKMPGTMSVVAMLAKLLKVTPEWLVFGRSYEGNNAVKDTVTAIGVGGENIELPEKMGHDDLMALWPGVWAPATNGPPEDMIVVCSPSALVGQGWMVWMSKGKYWVGMGKVGKNSNGKITFPGAPSPTLKAIGRVVLVMEKP